MGWFGNWFASGLAAEELARRLDMPTEQLRAVRPEYQSFTVPKRSGGSRRIFAPEPELKALQRRVLRRLLNKLRCHPAAVGFRPGESFVTNAQRHVGKAVVICFDLCEFFPATSAARVGDYFRAIGWGRDAANMLTSLCTWENGLPQGAPTSPALSNLVNFQLDARMAGLAAACGATYTRYADDLTFSLAEDRQAHINVILGSAGNIVRDFGYRMHRRRKQHVRRRHQRQIVTGLVVNEKVQLPREVRRWLRAVKHRAGHDWRDRPAFDEPFRPSKSPTLSDEQFAGWLALESMIERQAR